MRPLPGDALENAIQESAEDPIFDPDSDLPPDWWTIFDDSQLTQFIEITLARNPTLQSAKRQILAALYYADYVRSDLYPNITWGADVARDKLSTTGVIPFNSGTNTITVPVTPGASSGIPEYFTQYETEFKLMYDFDFWGKNRNSFRAALGQVRANIAEAEFAKLVLAVAVAKVYFELQIDYEKLNIAQTIYDNRLENYELVGKRIQANLDNKIDLNTAESDLAAAAQLVQQVKSDKAIHEYQLKAYLAGNFEEQIFDVNIAEKPLNKIPLPQDIPLNLVARRPDIISQLWLIESAGRQIEVAKAGFYPDFNLFALFGYQTIHLRELFRWPSSYFDVNPAVSLPIFDGGKLQANLRGSQINYDLAILDYNEMVLNAARDVLQSVAVVKNLNLQLNQSKAQEQAQQDLYQIIKMRVAHNLNNKLDELKSDKDALTASFQYMDTKTKLYQAILNLIQSIGGGYEVCN